MLFPKLLKTITAPLLQKFLYSNPITKKTASRFVVAAGIRIIFPGNGRISFACVRSSPSPSKMNYKRVKGEPVERTSAENVKQKAVFDFRKARNYDLIWNILIDRNEFGEQKSKMGHAVYAAGGTDYNTKQCTLFSKPKKSLEFYPLE